MKKFLSSITLLLIFGIIFAQQPVIVMNKIRLVDGTTVTISLPAGTTLPVSVPDGVNVNNKITTSSNSIVQNLQYVDKTPFELQGKTTAQANVIYFPGYLKNYSIKSYGTKTSWTGSWIPTADTTDIFNKEAISGDGFDVLLSSPSLLILSLDTSNGGTSAYWKLTGYKDK